MASHRKIALITGASRGIGKAVAIGLAKDGYQICLLARSQKDLQHVADVIIEENKLSTEQQPLIYVCDVTNLKQIEEVVADIVKKTGQIDLLFNNAGILRHGTLENVKDFQDQINVNLVGAFHVLHVVVPYMKKRKQGYIFNLASICGKVGYADIGAYTASKFGLVGLNESLLNELAPHNISVTAICPGYVATDMTTFAEFPPQNLMIQPEDILQIMRGLLTLSPHACVQEVVVRCRATIGGRE